MSIDIDIRNLRRDYNRTVLNESILLDNPMDLFKNWLEEAVDNELKEPNAMVLSTVYNNKPKARVVLLKQVINDKLLFFTNYNSNKGKEIELNPNVTLTFFWEELQRQVRIEGIAVKSSEEISDEYFSMRGKESQIAAWTSLQSQEITKEDLDKNLRRLNTIRHINYSSSEEENNDIIQFGMQDVEERINKITRKIAHSSMIGFSDITAEMLHQLLTDFPSIKNKKRSKDDYDKLKIMLERIGQKLSSQDIQQINDYIITGKTDNKGLIFFIDKLIELYNNLENQDNSIKKFRDVCNHYLVEKQYVYNDRDVNLSIKHNNPKYLEHNDTDTIDLNKLSSGEKQIVSLFSKIYLEENDRFIIWVFWNPYSLDFCL